jgi:hypothetical protein
VGSSSMSRGARASHGRALGPLGEGLARGGEVAAVEQALGLVQLLAAKELPLELDLERVGTVPPALLELGPEHDAASDAAALLQLAFPFH